MIVMLNGNVNFPITLDVGVWMFDDRKMEFEQLFTTNNDALFTSDEDENKKASERWDRELRQDEPLSKPVDTNNNKMLTRKERNKILESTYAISIKPFLKNAEPKENASKALLLTNNGEHEISLDDLENGFFLFAKDGKPLQDGPLYFYFGDGSNKDTPIKEIKEIKIA